MSKMSKSGLAATASTPNIDVDSDLGGTVPPIEPPSLPPTSPNGRSHKEHAKPTSLVEPGEGRLHSLEPGEGDFWVGDAHRQNDEDLHRYLAPDDEDAAHFLDDDPANMSSWAGQPSVKGSSEVMRMMLLTFSSVGMTFVQAPLDHYQTDN